jgi:hypothetical protein
VPLGIVRPHSRDATVKQTLHHSRTWDPCVSFVLCMHVCTPALWHKCHSIRLAVKGLPCLPSVLRMRPANYKRCLALPRNAHSQTSSLKIVSLISKSMIPSAGPNRTRNRYLVTLHHFGHRNILDTYGGDTEDGETKMRTLAIRTCSACGYDCNPKCTRSFFVP